MKQRLFLFAAMAAIATLAYAGGLMTNTNYHIAFDRMMARGASTEIDAAYSNPAGLLWTDNGLQLSLNFQKPWQRRDIEATFPLQQQMYGNATHKYKGEASAPIVPALFAVYKNERWALSSMIGIVGSGGFVKYDEGVPMFNLMLASMLSAKGVQPEQYELKAQMKGKQYIYGGQLNFSYKILPYLAASIGIRANYYDGYYRGHVIADSHPLLGDLAALRLDVDQQAWGFAPIVAACYKQGPLTVAARYEFRTKINTENSTNTLEATLGGKLQQTLAATDPAALQTIAQNLGEKTAPYQDGAKTRYDMPALLSFAVGYELSPKLRATAEYHFFDDKHAKMAGNRQETLAGGTHEFLLGVEYDVNDKLTVSCGGQRTDYGLSDDYEQNTSFACDSYSVGLGGAWNLSEKIRLNAGYFVTIYSDYTKEQKQFLGTPYPGTEVYSRTNNVIGVGIDYKF